MLKTLWRGHMLLVILKVKKLLKGFAKMNFKKQIKNSLGLKKKKKKEKNAINCILNGKVSIIPLTVGLIKKT